MDCGDADRAHQLRQRLDAALRLAELLGEARCVVSVCPDPQPLDGMQRSALDSLYAANAGCVRSEAIGGGHAPGAPSPYGGLCVFFTGLSGSGKSTLARALHARLVETSGCAVTLLDGDTVRRHLSRGLGFSRADRDANVLRIGYVASRVVMHAGLVICAPIAPYAATRAAVRDMVQAHGRFVEVHVAAPLAVCEARDPKGLYAKSRSGQIKTFTGVSDPYEAPGNPECRIDTSQLPVAEAVDQLLQVLVADSGIRGTRGLTRHTSS
jgi:sulfate adenylyltransferase